MTGNVGDSGHSAATSLPCIASLGHLTGGYVARYRSPKFRLAAELHIAPNCCPKSGSL